MADNAQLRGGYSTGYDFTSTIALAAFLVVLALLQIMLRPLFATLAATQTIVFTSPLKLQLTSIYAYIGIFAYKDLGSIFYCTSHR